MEWMNRVTPASDPCDPCNRPFPSSRVAVTRKSRAMNNSRTPRPISSLYFLKIFVLPSEPADAGFFDGRILRRQHFQYGE
jgi:hypothetical protein